MKGKVFYRQRSPRGEYSRTVSGLNYQILAVMQLNLPNGQPLVAVDHNQLLALTSETVCPTDWSLLLPLTVQYFFSATCTVQIDDATVGNGSRNFWRTRQPPCHSGIILLCNKVSLLLIHILFQRHVLCGHTLLKDFFFKSFLVFIWNKSINKIFLHSQACVFFSYTVSNVEKEEFQIYLNFHEFKICFVNKNNLHSVGYDYLLNCKINCKTNPTHRERFGLIVIKCFLGALTNSRFHFTYWFSDYV